MDNLPGNILLKKMTSFPPWMIGHLTRPILCRSYGDNHSYYSCTHNQVMSRGQCSQPSCPSSGFYIFFLPSFPWCFLSIRSWEVIKLSSLRLSTQQLLISASLSTMSLHSQSSLLREASLIKAERGICLWTYTEIFRRQFDNMSI